MKERGGKKRKRKRERGKKERKEYIYLLMDGCHSHIYRALYVGLFLYYSFFIIYSFSLYTWEKNFLFIIYMYIFFSFLLSSLL